MGVAAECKEMFLELQMKKAHRYIIFKIDEKGKEVAVEKTGAVTESFDDFMGSLPETDCRYAVYDFDFVTEENCQKSKIFFIAWSAFLICLFYSVVYTKGRTLASVGGEPVWFMHVA
jgi:cofilin